MSIFYTSSTTGTGFCTAVFIPGLTTIGLDEACRRYGVEHEVVIYPGVDHSFIWDDSDNEKYNRDAHIDSWNRAVNFLKRHMMPNNGQ